LVPFAISTPFEALETPEFYMIRIDVGPSERRRVGVAPFSADQHPLPLGRNAHAEWPLSWRVGKIARMALPACSLFAGDFSHPTGPYLLYGRRIGSF
jgi:hypothetical protein